VMFQAPGPEGMTDRSTLEARGREHALNLFMETKKRILADATQSLSQESKNSRTRAEDK